MNRIQTTLKQKATETNTALWIIEKDYALSYLLSALFKVSLFTDSLVLKGGTALKRPISRIIASRKTWIFQPKSNLKLRIFKMALIQQFLSWNKIYRKENPSLFEVSL